MKVFAASVLIASVAAAPVGLNSKLIGTKNKFALFKEKFNKNYRGAELASRFQTFVANDAMIAKHNAKGLSWTLGHNEFSDMTWAEFSSGRVNGHKPNQFRAKQFQTSEELTSPAADSVDWVAQGAVTPIKDQGQCGSCWAFSTIGSIEGAYQIATGELLSLSEQDLVSCDHNGDQGCNGGLMDNAFDWVISGDGICSEADYPYTSGGGDSGSCVSSCSPAVVLTGYTDVANEDGMLAALNVGPVSVAVEADKSAWQFYSSGVLDDAGCGTSLDHGVLAVGYGTDGKDYYNVKNSWGSSWGESGYIRLVRGKNQCGIASAASYATGAAAAAPPAPTPPTIAPPPTPATAFDSEFEMMLVSQAGKGPAWVVQQVWDRANQRFYQYEIAKGADSEFSQWAILDWKQGRLFQADAHYTAAPGETVDPNRVDHCLEIPFEETTIPLDFPGTLFKNFVSSADTTCGRFTDLECFTADTWVDQPTNTVCKDPITKDTKCIKDFNFVQADSLEVFQYKPSVPLDKFFNLNYTACKFPGPDYKFETQFGK